MPRYYLGLFRHHVPFAPDVVERTLAVLGRWLPGFFPARLPVQPNRPVVLSSPSDYRPSLLPASFTIDKGDKGDTSEAGAGHWIPVHGHDGNKVEIVDDRGPDPGSARVLVWFGPRLPPTDRLESLLCDLIESLGPEQAWLTDGDTPIENDIDDIYGQSVGFDSSKVPPALYWMTWLSPSLLAEAGDLAWARIRAMCHLRPVAGGVLVRVQDHPSEGTDGDWNERRRAVEEAFGLERLQERFGRGEGDE